MTTALSWLVARLQAYVPDLTSTQYEICCEDAVADLARRKPLQKFTTLNIVSGTAAYTLPADFIRLATLEGLSVTGEGQPSGVMVTSAGLIDFGAAYSEQYTVHGQTLTISPTPQYTVARRMWYAAAHTLDGDDAYPELTREDARLALIEAQAQAWELKSAALLATAYSFTIGDWSENHGPQLEKAQAQAKALHDAYDKAVKQAVGPVGTRGRGNVWTARLGEGDV